MTAKGIGGRRSTKPAPKVFETRHPFFIGAARPRRSIRSRTWQPASLKGKVEAGAQFSQTQFLHGCRA